MIEIDDFIKKIAEQFEQTNPLEITASTHFQELKDWDSLVVLSIIGMAHNTYGVNLIGSEVRAAKTVQDIYNMVVFKIST